MAQIQKHMSEMRFQRIRTDRITVAQGKFSELIFIDIHSSLTHINFELTRQEALELSALLAAEAFGENDRD